MTRLLTCLCILLIGCSCTEYTPKPRGLFRIDLPKASYQPLPDSGRPYRFSISKHATLEVSERSNKKDWINMAYPSLNAKIYCSYQPVTRRMLPELEQDCRELIERTASRADKIDMKMYEDASKEVYATVFFIDGQSPAPVQFLITDSVSRFFRGALYYDCKPNADSLAPVTQYLRQDIVELIQSFEWKKL